MTAHIHSSATSKSSLFKRLVILTIVVSVLIYLAFTFSLFSVPTKFQKQQQLVVDTKAKEGTTQQEAAPIVANAQKPTGIVVQAPPASAVEKKKKIEKPEPIKQEEEEHEDLGMPPQKPVQDLSGENYDDFIKSSPNALVYVFSPSCPHCIHFAPTFDKLVVELGKIYGGKVNVGKVIGPNHIQTLVVPLGVKGYPTLMFYTDGNLKSKKFYEGARKIPDILAFIEKQIK